MPRPSSPSPADDTDYALELQELLVNLLQDPQRESVASEIQVLQSIYGDDAIRVWHPASRNGNNEAGKRDSTIRYEVVMSLPAPHENVSIKVLVSVPESYPTTSAPQLQLLSKYIGSLGADSNLFGSILRTYISVNGVEWSEDSVCVFDGLQNVLDRCVAWYEDKLSSEKAGDLARDDAKESTVGTPHPPVEEKHDDKVTGVSEPIPVALPAGVHIFTAEPITDRKSAFVGRACRIHHPSEVPLILSHLMSDRRTARAAHPIINAWRCQTESVLHQGSPKSFHCFLNFLDTNTDNDDDGETAAGGRLAHLLQILEVDNVLVVVTRYFGGIHLGPDRFKHINQAARNALELGGFLDAAESKKTTGRATKKH